MKKKIIWIFFLPLFFIGCGKNLEQLPESTTSKDAVFSTEKGLELYANSFYQILPSANNIHTADNMSDYAARRDAQYQKEGTGYLTKALRLGLPREVIDTGRGPLKPLWTDEVEQLAQNAPLAKKGYLYRRFWRQDLPLSADWQAIGPPRAEGKTAESAVASRR